LRQHHTDCAGPPPIRMHGRNCVFGQPVLDEAHPGGGAGAIMRPSLKFVVFHRDLLQCTMEMGAV